MKPFSRDAHLKTNLHTHTTFCDGKNSAEEMLEAAIRQHIDVLGFSSHSMYPFASDWHIAPTQFDAYCDEILRLKQLYADTIEVLLGFESEYISGLCVPRFENYALFKPDYLIGSVHFIGDENCLFTVDNTPEELQSGITGAYKGSAKEAISAYFAREREMLSKGSFSIIGHPDLVRKFNASMHLFDENDSWYKSELQATAKEIARAGIIAEINTGGMVRAGLESPYPSAYFLSLLYENGVPITITSDAHRAEHIDACFDFAREYAKKAGYREFAVPHAGSVDFYRL